MLYQRGARRPVDQQGIGATTLALTTSALTSTYLL